MSRFLCLTEVLTFVIQNVSLVPFLNNCFMDQLDMMAQMLARRAEDREVPGNSPARD